MGNLKKIHYAWWIFLSTCIISLVGFGLVINTVGLFYDPVGKALGIGRGEVALMSTFQNVASAVTLLFAGKIMGKINIKVILSVAFAVIGLGLMSLSVGKSILQFYVVWTFIGIASPFAIMLPIPILLGNWFEKKLGTVMGFSLGISAIGGAVFNPIISTIITNNGWRTGYIISGAIVLIALLPLTLFVIKGKPQNGTLPYGHDEADNTNAQNIIEGLSFKEALKTPMFYLVAAAMIALQYVAGFVQHISAHIVNIGLPLTIGASVISGVMLGAAAGKISIGWCLDRFNNAVVIIIYGILGVIGWSGLVTANTSSLLIASGFSLGIGQGILLVSLPYFIRKFFGSKDYGNIYSIISMFGAAASAVAVSLDGAVFDSTGSYTVPLWTNVILYIAATVSIVFAIKLTRKVIKKNYDQFSKEEINNG